MKRVNVDFIIRRVVNTIGFNTEDPSKVYMKPNSCHAACAFYIRDKGKPTDLFILFGDGKTVTHSIVVSNRNKVLVDTFKTKGQYNPQKYVKDSTYTVFGAELVVMASYRVDALGAAAIKPLAALSTVSSTGLSRKDTVKYSIKQLN